MSNVRSNAALLLNYTRAVLVVHILSKDAFPTAADTHMIVDKCVMDFAAKNPALHVEPLRDVERMNVSQLGSLKLHLNNMLVISS
jgi:hypothetical protein